MVCPVCGRSGIAEEGSLPDRDLPIYNRYWYSAYLVKELNIASNLHRFLYLIHNHQTMAMRNKTSPGFSLMKFCLSPQLCSPFSPYLFSVLFTLSIRCSRLILSLKASTKVFVIPLMTQTLERESRLSHGPDWTSFRNNSGSGDSLSIKRLGENLMGMKVNLGLIE